ncbi:MAG: hypothetical protein ACI9UO_001172 [Nitrospinales bacterium]|jgi:hypothetical protein
MGNVSPFRYKLKTPFSILARILFHFIRNEPVTPSHFAFYDPCKKRNPDHKMHYQLQP